MRSSNVEVTLPRNTAVWNEEQQIVAGALSPAEFQSALRRERARADRDERQFSVVLVHGDGLESAAAAENVINEIARGIRVIDSIGWFDERRIGLLLPGVATAQTFAAAKQCERRPATWRVSPLLGRP